MGPFGRGKPGGGQVAVAAGLNAPTGAADRCLSAGCLAVVTKSAICCPEHWAKVPRYLRHEVLDALMGEHAPGGWELLVKRLQERLREAIRANGVS